MKRQGRPFGERWRWAPAPGLALAIITCMASCKDPQSQPKRDIAALARIVRFPVQPLEVWFASVPRGTGGEGLGPSDYTFIAIMRFEAAPIDRFLADARPTEHPDLRFPRNDVVEWFPPPVVGAMEPVNAKYLRVRGRCFDGAPFAKAHFAGGRFCVLDSAPYIILHRPEN